MSDSFPENRVLLAINAIRSTPRLSIRRAAEIYNVPKSTIADRMKGKIAKSDSYHGRSNLTKIEEEAIEDHLARWVLTEAALGVPPTYAQIREFASRIL
ncbi:hypothetical protein N657DRAFT_571152 [Parathielavia appendiculata]|uniref:HTH psq-type domain-containing protein n=1 Tax=Parathielavia appendiculata TaxID=2587402 RepID=A0AAN6U0R2_9PEZI|nr:hypothetical protein N657DRAFT_571152 [Parathielavia appendiculata]